jgi:choline dehydrogenase-like flavoprotein
MSNDPGSGVVDRNCRVHSVTNLYIAGSSVFPTGGYVTPTFTIVALALRMADHIRGNLG